MSPRTIQRRVIEGIAEAPYSNVTVKVDVPRSSFNYLKERKDEFPGVDVEKLFLRAYPHKELGAQLFGTLREISPTELKKKKYRGVAAGTRIGAGGIEQAYDRYLRGQDGYTRVVINALGNRDDTREVTRREPQQGQRLRLTLDLGLERAANNALKQAIAAANGNGNPAKAGAYVAMDPTNGEVLALGSYPSFDANLFAKPLSQEKFDALNSEANGAPLFNRAIAAAYPTGSTFKPITAMASLGVGHPHAVADDLRRRRVQARPADVPERARTRATARSTSRRRSRSPPTSSSTRSASAPTRAARSSRSGRKKLGLGHRTGIDIPGEFGGLVPDRKWRDAGYAKYQKCVKREKVPAQTFAALKKCGGIERPWSDGRQRQPRGRPGRPAGHAAADGDRLLGDRQRRARRAAAPGDERRGRPRARGRGVPHHRASATSSSPRPTRTRSSRACTRAASEEGGTSADVFKGFAGGKLTVYGKTGTVERPGQPDQSWYACYVPHPSRPIVVVVTVEKGGFGAETAAPAARLILSNWFDLGKDKFKQGSSATR